MKRPATLSDLVKSLDPRHVLTIRKRAFRITAGDLLSNYRSVESVCCKAFGECIIEVNAGDKVFATIAGFYGGYDGAVDIPGLSADLCKKILKRSSGKVTVKIRPKIINKETGISRAVIEWSADSPRELSFYAEQREMRIKDEVGQSLAGQLVEELLQKPKAVSNLGYQIHLNPNVVIASATA